MAKRRWQIQNIKEQPWCQFRRFSYLINADKVFGTHRLLRSYPRNRESRGLRCRSEVCWVVRRYERITVTRSTAMLLITVIVIAVLVLILIYASIRILREYERGVVFTLGRYTGTKGPVLFLLVPFVQQMVRVDLRVIVDEVPPQDVISRDNVSVKVSAVIYFRVVDAERAIIQVSNYLLATSQLAQTTLRWVLGKHDLDQMLAERDKLNADIQDV